MESMYIIADALKAMLEDFVNMISMIVTMRIASMDQLALTESLPLVVNVLLVGLVNTVKLKCLNVIVILASIVEYA